MQTAKMMGIPDENIVQLRDTSFDNLEREFQKLEDKIIVFARELTPLTGILGITSTMTRGLSWDRIKENVMQLQAPFEYIEIDLTPEEQNAIKECVQKQEAFDAAGEIPGTNLSNTMIFGCTWKNIKDLIMNGQKDV